MKSSNSHFHKLSVDGQEILIPDITIQASLLQATEIDDIPIAVPQVLGPYLKFVQHYPDHLKMGLRPVGVCITSWLPLVLLKTDRGWQRVHLERLVCDMCGWQGGTANPGIADLYHGTANWWETFMAAINLPAVPCPCCGAVLPRHPIWTEPCKGSIANSIL